MNMYEEVRRANGVGPNDDPFEIFDGTSANHTGRDDSKRSSMGRREGLRVDGVGEEEGRGAGRPVRRSELGQQSYAQAASKKEGKGLT
jgi:hypothetical protein